MINATTRWLLTVCVSLLSFVVGQDLRADESPQLSAEGIRFFEEKIRPVLVENCYRCHSADGQGLRGGLAVDNRDAMLAGGESGPAIVPGDPEQSLVWNAINHRDFSMPPNRKLPTQVIADFRTWIDMGAPDPRVATAAVVKSRVTAEDIQTGRSFWAFKPPVLPTISQDHDSAWARTDIDRLVEQTLVRNNLRPSEDTDPYTLLRRIHYDISGLPPTTGGMASFAKAFSDDADKAIAEEVDRLLNQPQFGERWGRHWLDAARYAESAGREIDMSFPNAWRYRDYVIDAFNSDKPYDKFVQEQVAGDLLPAATDAEWAEHLIATGFLALGPKALIEQNPRQFRVDLIDEQIDVTTRVVMGVSVACARCHDHKFDPIPQTDYYALAGIFQSTETYFGGSPNQRNRQPSNLIILPVDDPNSSEQPLSKSELAELVQQRDQARQDYAEARRAARQSTVSANGGTDPRRALANSLLLDQKVAQLTNRINGVDQNGQPLTFCMGVLQSDQPRNARVLVRGEIDQPAQEVDRGFVQVLSESSQVISGDSSGRLELARWMTSRHHPLTARVMVNRIWQHLLGAAIVREPDNFGASGPAPTHPELLDYLAVTFMDEGWSVKNLIRQIMISRVYRQSSAYDPVRFETDPANNFLSRANTRRLDAEAIRDGMLAVSGQLDLLRPRGSMIADLGNTLLGPNGPAIPVMSSGMQAMSRSNQTPSMFNRERTPGERLPGQGVAALRSRSRQGFSNPFEASVPYRSVYLPVPRNAPPHSLDVFDFAEPSLMIGQREISNTPAQALYLLNNPFVMEQADALARRLVEEERTSTAQIDRAFRLVYNRPPATEEIRASQEFFKNRRSMTTGTSRGFRRGSEQSLLPLSEFCQALFASAEFQYLN